MEPPGHAAVAAIAYRQLAADKPFRTTLTNLLKNHPKFNIWKSEFNAKKQSFPAGVDSQKLARRRLALSTF